ncbi:MAG: Holliday junction branch migration protein RuvA [Candidatus Moraniibacteriota bacterium]|nr:MAG: Holliday junction branch migration protein RuvA [Candidatus Moranbacteria bacterium]
MNIFSIGLVFWQERGKSDSMRKDLLIKSVSMIATLHGRVESIRGESVIISIGGIGYRVFVTQYALGKISMVETVFLYIYTHVREDILALYGFLDEEELTMFEFLIGVSGVGPKAALSILSVADPATLQSAVINEDVSILTRVSGIGKKIAGRIVLDLKSKVEKMGFSGEKRTSQDTDAIDALMAMGYSVSDARDVLKDIPKEITDVGDRVKRALRNLGNRNS